MKRIMLLLALMLLLMPLTAGGENALYVKKVENLPEDFLLGMDASCVPALERSGVKYYGFDGREQDVFKTLKESGVNIIRVRVWNDPYDADGNGYGGGNCDIENAVLIGKRAARYGLSLLVDLHLSDFWADPGKQMAPKAWQGMEIEEKTEAVYQFVRDCLCRLREENIPVGMVQIGNETNGKLCGEKTWFNIQYLMQAGAKATREVYPEALVALHFTNPEKAGNLMTYAKKMDYYQVDYDVFASSYYPYWHGSLENLASVLSEVAQTYGKKVMVMETSYAYTAADTDFNGNTISEGGAFQKDYPFTVQGQMNCVRNIVDTVANKTVNGIGVIYWEGTWIAVGGRSWEENHALWEKFGSGWASSFAAQYDPNDAGKYYGGCAVENQALFDETGRPLPSLRVFSLLRTGQEAAIVPDAIEDVFLTCDINGEVTLPETVNAVMNDDSRQALPVRWNVKDEEIAAMRAKGSGKYAVTGEAGGMEARLTLSLVEYNYLVNPGFEDGDTGWTVTDLRHADELYIEEKATDSLSGKKHLHFWSAAPYSVEFTAEQQINDLPAGQYRYTVSIMGGDCGETNIYAYAKVDGETVAIAPMKITSFGNWDTVTVPDFACAPGQSVAVGVYVQCQGTGSGAWGKIDDAVLNSVSGGKK